MFDVGESPEGSPQLAIRVFPSSLQFVEGGWRPTKPWEYEIEKYPLSFRLLPLWPTNPDV